MKRKSTKQINDEIKRLLSLVNKNKADKRNEVRQKKVQTLKEIKKLNQKLKRKQIKPKQYSIQYKDLTKKLKAHKNYYKITKKDLIRKSKSRADRYASIFSWNNSLERGIIGAFARGGKLDNILGFEVSEYLDSVANYKSIMEKLQNEYSEEFYDLLDEYFKIGDLSFQDILKIMSQDRYAVWIDKLFYRDPNSPRFDFDYFETTLREFMDVIRTDYSKL